MNIENQPNNIKKYLQNQLKWSVFPKPKQFDTISKTRWYRLINQDARMYADEAMLICKHFNISIEEIIITK